MLAWLTVAVALPLNIFVAAKLYMLSRRSPEIRVLRERAVIAVTLALIVGVFGLVFLQNDLTVPVLNGGSTRLITRSVLLVLAVGSALYFLLRLYARSD